VNVCQFYNNPLYSSSTLEWIRHWPQERHSTDSIYSKGAIVA